MIKSPGILVAALLGAAVATGCAGSDVRVSQPEQRAEARPNTTLAQRAESQLPRTEPATDAQPAPLSQSDEPKGTGVPIQGTEMVRGSATVVVHAPIDKVREAVLGFGEYSQFMPHYKKCKLLGRTPAGSRDVYMEITALHGAVSMWGRLEVPKPAVVDGVETVEMKLIEGNVKDLKGTWRFSRVDDDHTQLTLEVFLLPNIPLPMSILNEENVKGAVNGVVAMRTRAEKSVAAPQ